MNRLIRRTGLALVSLLACRCPPRELMCKPIAFYEVIEPGRGAGAAPFSIERLGRKVEWVQPKVDFVTLKNDNRMYVGWSLLDFDVGGDMIYSPAEGLARDVENPELVYPMKRFKKGWTEHVRFGFRSSVCPEPDKSGSYVFCQYAKDEWFLVADMTCQSVLAEEVLEEL